MDADFWSYWHDDYGFDKAAWYRDYLQNRAAKPLKPGRTRSQAVSTTRKRIELAVKAAAPVRCLETNLHPVASASAAELHQENRQSEVIAFLLNHIRPTAVIAHGAEAVDYMRRLKTGAQIIESAHFASRGGMSDAGVEELGKRLAQEAIGS